MLCGEGVLKPFSDLLAAKVDKGVHKSYSDLLDAKVGSSRTILCPSF